MSPRILLVDVDRTDEPLEAQVEQLGQAVLRLSVPNTSVTFEMRRHDDHSPYEGSLGGRCFIFDPSAMTSTRAKKSSSARKRKDDEEKEE